MNIDTGELRYLEEGEKPKDNEIPVLMEDATDLQKRLMRVSPHDNRSTLGKARIKARRSKYEPHVGAKQLAKQAHA
jgi:hypothetical protein